VPNAAAQQEKRPRVGRVKVGRKRGKRRSLGMERAKLPGRRFFCRQRDLSRLVAELCARIPYRRRKTKKRLILNVLRLAHNEVVPNEDLVGCCSNSNEQLREQIIRWRIVAERSICLFPSVAFESAAGGVASTSTRTKSAKGLPRVSVVAVVRRASSGSDLSASVWRS
jgi:hypothetical protein